MGEASDFHSLLVAGAVGVMSGASDGGLGHWAWAEAAVVSPPLPFTFLWVKFGGICLSLIPFLTAR